MTPRMSYDERMAAHREKVRRTLAFLRTETWTIPDVLAVLLGTVERRADRAVVSRLLASLARDSIVVTDQVAGRLVVGLTPTGQSQAAAVTGKPPGRPFERGRIPTATLDHRLDLQKLRIMCARAGWSGWVYPDRQMPQEKNAMQHRPDASATSPSNLRIAIEVERTVKTAKRYRFIVGRHLSQIEAGMYAHVIYACPTPALSQSVRSVFFRLGHAVVNGQDKKLSESDLGKFSFLSYDELPNWRP